VGRGVQEVEDGPDGEGIGFERGRVIPDDLWRYVVGGACDGPFLHILEF
jgi:hypothetical protein